MIQPKCRGVILTLVLIFSLFMNAMAQSSPSEMRINLSEKNITVEQLFKKIHEQTKLNFVYNVKDLRPLKRVNVEVKNETVNAVLKKVLGEQGVAYEFSGMSIIVKMKLRVIQGQILDHETDEPLVGASVLIPNTDVGVLTNAHGVFSLSLHEGYTGTLSVSYIGYKSTEIPVTHDDIYKISLESDAKMMDEVLISSYFTRKKEGFAGAMTTITQEDIQRVNTGNIFTTLSALDAGFKVLDNNDAGSNPNRTPDFNIRGRGSFEAKSSRPLFILDGFEVSVDKIYDLDVNRIESINILKDASATILYGSRAANGVVVVETVTPKDGTLRLTYDFKGTANIVDLSDYNLMNAKEKLEYERLAGVYDHVAGSNALTGNYEKDRLYNQRLLNVLEGVDTDWIAQTSRNAFAHAHSLYLEGGAKTIRYGLNTRYSENPGVMKGSSRDRFSLDFNLIYRIKDKVIFRNTMSFSQVKGTNSPYGSFNQYTLLNPYEKIYDDKGELLKFFTNQEPNPLYDVKLPHKNEDRTKIFSEQLNVDWHINRDLRFVGKFKYETSDTKGEFYKSPFSTSYILTRTYNSATGLYERIPVEQRGSLRLSYEEKTEVEGSVTLNYSKKFADSHLIYAGAGSELTSRIAKSAAYAMSGFMDDRFADPGYAIKYSGDKPRPTSSSYEERSIGFFANVNYIFDSRYFADLSFRYDGSSKFGVNNRFAPFWSMGGGWNLHNESFMKKTGFSQLKLRASYGISGNQAFASHMARTTYEYHTDRLYEKLIGATILAYGNEDLKWQSTRQLNLGVNMRMLNNIVTLSFDYYNKVTSNLLTDITVAPSLGLAGDTYKENLGKIQNEGIDFRLDILFVNKKDFTASAFIQGIKNKNTLKKISNSLKRVNDRNNSRTTIPGEVYEEGQSMSALKVVPSLGIDPYTGKEIYLKRNGDRTYVWDAKDKVVVGDTEPDLEGNFGGRVFWKGFYLNFGFRYRLGGYEYNTTLVSKVENNNPQNNADRRAFEDRWSSPGERALYKNIRNTEATKISSRFVQKNNYLILNTLSLSYEFPRQMLSKVGLEALRVNMYTTDILRFSTVKAERGIGYPFQRSFMFGFAVTL